MQLNSKQAEYLKQELIFLERAGKKDGDYIHFPHNQLELGIRLAAINLICDLAKLQP